MLQTAEEAISKLELGLSSPRERPPGTVNSYLQTARSFLRWRASMQPLSVLLPVTPEDFRRYFVWRRQNGISERTLAKEFAHLGKLARSNSWDWPFTKADRPVSRDEAFTPAFTPADLEALIAARDAYTPQERFYLAISTTWGRRREEMVKIRKKDCSTTSISIQTAKQPRGPSRKEKLIPEEIRDILLSYHPKITAVSTLSSLFCRLMEKSGLEMRKGWGWHSIRRTLETAVQWKLAENQLPLSLVGDFFDWSRTRSSTAFGGAPMAGVYTHHEVMLSGDFAVDRLILPIHPFLPCWRQQKGASPLPGGEGDTPSDPLPQDTPESGGLEKIWRAGLAEGLREGN